MGTVYKGLFQGRWLPQMRLVRNKHKHNISKPRLPHFERHVVEHVVCPYFLKKKKPQHLPDTAACNGGQTVAQRSLMEPFYDLLAKELLEKIRAAKLIGFFHVNSFSDDDLFESRVILKKNGMKYIYHNKNVINKALIGSEYETLLQLYKGPTVITASEEVDIPKLLKVSKKIRKFTLMAALIDDIILSCSELKYYGQYESLDAARVKFVQTLNSASQTLVQQISRHPTTLVQCLNQRVDDLKRDDSSGS